MDGLFRSEDMHLYQLQVPNDDKHAVMDHLGELGTCHFIDLNEEELPQSLDFTRQIKSIEESEKKMQYLLDQCTKHYYPVQKPDDSDGFKERIARVCRMKDKSMQNLLDDIQKDVSEQEHFIRQQNIELTSACETLRRLKDNLQVMIVAQEMIPELQGQFDQVRGGDVEDPDSGREHLQADNADRIGLINSNAIKINHIAGVINQEDIGRLRRLIFRQTKGKSFIHIQEITDPEEYYTKNLKSVYIIVFWEGENIRNRIERVCDSFAGQRYDLPEISQIDAQMRQLATSIENAKNVVDGTRGQLRDQLVVFDGMAGGAVSGMATKQSSTIWLYKMYFAKEKQVYLTLNKMKKQGGRFTGFFWGPFVKAYEFTT